MKPFIKFFALLCCITAVTFVVPQKASAQVSVSFQVFYDGLSPYGTWVNTADYGYAWIPDVDDGFMPYNTNGYWIYTDAGWTWVSEYAWGWAPFHYGRWFTDPEYGPMWIPGNEWGPGWVSWRQAEGYYGWAPIGPGINIDVAYGSSYNQPYNQWTFVRNRNFGRSNMNRYYMNRANNFTIFNNSTVINNLQSDRDNHVRYNGGPNRTEVQKRTGQPVAMVTVKENNTPGQHLSKSEFQVYKPRIQQNNDAGQKPVPAQVKNIKEVRAVKDRNAGIPAQRENQPSSKQPVQPQTDKQPDRQQPQPNKQPQRDQPGQQPNKQPENPQPMPPQKQQPVKQQTQPNKQPQRDQPGQQPNKQPERPQPMPPQRQQSQPNKQPQKQQTMPQQQQQRPQPLPQQRQQPQRQQTMPQQPQQQPAKQQQQRPQPMPQQRQPQQQPARQQQPSNKQPVKQQPQKEKRDNNA